MTAVLFIVSKFAVIVPSIKQFEVVQNISDFINNYFTEATKIESIIPVPPTKKRRFQPTIEIANELAKKQKVYSNFLD